MVYSLPPPSARTYQNRDGERGYSREIAAPADGAPSRDSADFSRQAEQPGGLIDQQQVLVLIQDADGFVAGGAINVSTMVDMSRCLKRVGADNSEFSARWRLRGDAQEEEYRGRSCGIA
jgi:hypothetical protein